MKKAGLVILVIMFGLLLGSVCEANWYPGIVHIHSTFSDGARTPDVLKIEAEKLLLSFLIVTDHFEQINQEKKFTGKFTDDFGFDKYLVDFSFEKPYICIAGCEISQDGCHTLAINNLKKISQEESLGANIGELLTKLDNLKALPIAAHPNLKDYLYDLRPEKVTKLAGIELFNDTINGGYQKTLKASLDLIAAGQNIFFTSGCDSHTEAQLTSMRKLTMVWSDKTTLTLDELYKCFEQGQTCATNNGAYIKRLNLLPQFKIQKVERPKFDFTIAFPVLTVSKKTIRIYCDGKLADGSTITLPAGRSEYTYSWEDIQALKGEHSYIIEMEGCLVISPIKLQITKALIPSEYEDWHPQTIASDDSLSDFIRGQGKRIAFLSNREGEVAIYWADIDDRKDIIKVERFYGIANFIERFNFSPSGHKVLLLDKKRNIYLLLSDEEKKQKQLVNLHLQNGGDLFPSWIDDSSFNFAATNSRIRTATLKETEKGQHSGNSKIEQILDVIFSLGNGSLKTEIKDPPEEAQFLTTRKDDKGFDQICLIDTDKRVTKWITKGDFTNVEPSVGQMGALSPLGLSGKILFATNKNGNFDLAILRDIESESRVEIIINIPSNETEPTWAYYCQKIFFVSDRSRERRIWQMNDDCTDQKMLELK